MGSSSPDSTLETELTSLSIAKDTKQGRKPPLESSSSPVIPILSKLNPSTLLKWHNFLLSCHLTNLSSDHTIEKDVPLKFKVITWNVNQILPQDADLGPILNSEIDIYVINLQETVSLTSLKKSTERIDDWGKILVASLNIQDTSKSFHVIHKRGLLGLTTILIASDLIADQIHNVSSDSLGLGYLRWGNKGCISLKFRVGGLDVGQEIEHDVLNYSHVDRLKRLPGIDFQVLNVHLVHGEGDAIINQRFDSWAKIGNKLKLIDPTVALTNTTLTKNTSGIQDERIFHAESDLNVHFKLSESEKLKLGVEGRKFFETPEFTIVHDPKTSVVVSGDTNYRLKTGWDNYLGATFDRQNVDNLVAKQQYSDLILRDQLTMERFKNNIMLGFKEAEINFPPTFKVNTTNPVSIIDENYFIPNYDSKRLPAYTDRILFVPRNHMILSKEGYESTPLNGSDHLPVMATFKVKIPFIDKLLVHRFKEEFSLYWDRVINKLKLIDLDPHVRAITKVGQISDLSDEGLFIQNIDCTGQLINVDVMCGETVIIALNLQNKCDELLKFDFKDEDSSRWFAGNKTIIDFAPLAHDECDEDAIKRFNDIEYPLNGHVLNGLCYITPKDNVLTTVEFKTSNPGTINKTFTMTIPSLYSIPAANRYIAITLNVKDIFMPVIQELEEYQYMNIVKSFDFLLSKPHSANILTKVKDMSSPNDFTTFEWDLVRILTLWEFKSHENLVQLFRVLYVWLKCQANSISNKNDEKSRTIFNYVLKTIMWLKLDNNDGYSWFGWLFNDPEDLLELLEREDYKFNLNL